MTVMRIARPRIVTTFLSMVLMLGTVFAASPSASASSHVNRTTPPTPLKLIPVEHSGDVYLLVRQGCREIRCLRLLRAANDGTSFKTVSLPPIKSDQGNPTGSLNEMVFVNDNVGYAVEGESFSTVLYATFNGAQSWQRLAIPKDDSIASVTTTRRFLYVVTMRCKKRDNDNVGCENYQLRRSTLKNRLLSATDIPNGRSYPWGFLGNVAASGNNVWLTEGAKWSLLVSSHDDGTTLVATSIHQIGSIAGCALSAMSSTSLWAQCSGGLESVFSFSRDAGKSWTTVPTNQWNNTGGGDFDPVSSNLAFLDYGQIPKGPNLFRITNSGRTVTAVGKLHYPDLWALDFTSAEAGLALCTTNYLTGILIRTVNGGVTWERVTLP